MKSNFISLITILIIFSVVETTFAQWSRTAPNIYPTTLTDKVGIGINSPLTNLQIHATSGPVMTLSNATSTTNALLGSIIGRGNGYTYNAAKIDMNIDAQNWSGGSYPSRITFWTNPSNTGGTLTERMRIDNQGNVGIGTTPGTGVRLNVLGGKVLFGATSTQISSTTNLEVVNGSIISVSAATNASFLSLSHNGVISANRTGTGTYQPIIFQTSNTERLRILANGNVGIGTTTPLCALDISGTGYFHLSGNTNPTTTSQGAYISWNALTGGTGETDFINNQGSGTGGFAFMNTPLSGSPRNTLMFITGSGNVLINKTTQVNTEYKLDINGKIRANEVVVNTTGADFVFNDDYNLKSLTEVETYIKENKHLPEIPNAKEMQKDGMSLSEMNTKLLQKVEELTLYIIDQEKRIKNLEDKNEK